MRSFLSFLFSILLSISLFAQHEPQHVKVIDNIAHQAIQVQTGWAGPIATHDIYTVPHDRIFVIEFVTISAAAEIWDCRITTHVKGTLVSHFLSVQPQSKKGEPGVVSQMVKIYADPGSRVSIWANTKENNTGMFTISGYLVPL